MRTLTTVMLALLTAISVTALTGCAGDTYHQKFGVARAIPVPDQDPIVGAWEGTWTDASGHTGKLKAIVTPLEGDTYQADFYATFFNDWFEHLSTAEFKGKRIGNKLVFSGQKDLGKLAGGVYHFEGYITPAYFNVDYRTGCCASEGGGTYELRRPEGVVPFAMR
jgi:hypothetical protein